MGEGGIPVFVDLTHLPFEFGVAVQTLKQSGSLYALLYNLFLFIINAGINTPIMEPIKKGAP